MSKEESLWLRFLAGAKNAFSFPRSYRGTHVGVGPDEDLAVEVPRRGPPGPPAPLGVLRLPQRPEPLLEGLLVLGPAVDREPVQDVYALELRPDVPLGHLAPQLAQDGVVDVVLARDLVGDADEPLDVLGLDGRLVGPRGLEHDLLELARRQALDLAVNVGRQGRRLLLRSLRRREHRVLDRGRVRHRVAQGGESTCKGRGLRGGPPPGAAVGRHAPFVAAGRGSPPGAAAGASPGRAPAGRRRVVVLVVVVVIVLDVVGRRRPPGRLPPAAARAPAAAAAGGVSFPGREILLLLFLLLLLRILVQAEIARVLVVLVIVLDGG